MPVKASINRSFELGVTRNGTSIGPKSVSDGAEQNVASNGGGGGVAAATPNGLLMLSPNEQNGVGDTESLQYLKPATDEQTVAWSEGTRVTDLLF